MVRALSEIMEPYAYLLLGIVVVLAAGFIQGLTSFGFALISMPILAAIMPLRQAVPIVVILSLCTNVAVLVSCFRFVDLKKIWLLILSSLLAAPVGTHLLLFLDGNVLKVITGGLIIIVGGILLSGKSFPIRHDKLAFVPVGALSGLLNGSISMSGPPVALFLSNQGVDKETFRANITAYGICLNVVTLISYLYSGLLSKQLLTYTSWFVPSMFLGVWLGIRALRKLDEKWFKKMALWIIILSGIWTILGVVMQ